MKTCRTIPPFIFGLLLAGIAHAVQLPAPLVETVWLAQHVKEVMILDVRADTKSFTADPVFARDKKTGKKVLVRIGGHVPGAVLLNFKEARTKRKIKGREVDKMLPTQAAFEQLMQKSGVNRDSAVVIVTKGQSSGDMTMAARMYWQIKYFGHDQVAILNGGMAQWITDGRRIDTEPSRPTQGNWRAKTGRKELLATSDDVARAVKTGSVQLMDNRSLGQYLGTTKRSYVYAKGHIPGAKTFPHEIMTEGGGPAKFLPVRDLRELAAALNVNTDRPTISYCNSGHLAAGGWFILSELMGNQHVKLYDGSMHQWTLEKQPVTKMKLE